MDASVNLLDSDSDSELEEDVMVCGAISTGCAMLWYGSQFIKPLQHKSMLSGQLWLNEPLGGHDGQFYNEIGMHKFIFLRPLTRLKTDVGLQQM